MAKFAFVVPPLDGHVNPTLGIGKELLKRGNEAAWIGVDPQLETILPAGGKFLFIVHNYDAETVKKLRKEQIQTAVRGIESLKTLYEVDLIPLNQFMLDGIMHHLAEYRPDVVIYDHQLFAGAVAAARSGLPFAASVTAQAAIKAFDALPKLHEWEDEQVVGFQQRNGIAGNRRLDDSASLILVYTSELFFGNKPLPPIYQFTGPIINDRPARYAFDWSRFESRKHPPCVLVTVGTTFESEEMQPFFQKVIDALKDEQLTVIMVSDPELFREIPDNFIIQKRIPQLELLPSVQAVICHAGQNTVSESLFFGIPLIVLPIAYDQSQVANDVTLCGAGIRMKFKRFKPEELKKAVREILSNEIYGKNARKIQISFREAGGVERAASLLENIIKN